MPVGNYEDFDYSVGSTSISLQTRGNDIILMFLSVRRAPGEAPEHASSFAAICVPLQAGLALAASLRDGLLALSHIAEMVTNLTPQTNIHY